MLGTDNFIRYLIGTFLTLLLMINIVYAFNLVNTLGLPHVFDNGNIDYSDKYFGIVNLIDSYQYFFDNNDMLNGWSTIMGKEYSLLNNLSLSNLFGFQVNWGADSGSDVLGALISLFNIFINVPYTLMLVIYFLMFLIYVLLILFTFIGYMLYLLSGAVYSTLPNTYNLLIFLPIY